MTREEAIKVIQEYRDMASGCNLDHDVEGFDMAIESLSADKYKYNRHEVACILAEAFGDKCACNYNGNDEWLSQVCDFKDTSCPTPVGVACWEQYLKYVDSRHEPSEDVNKVQTSAEPKWIPVSERLPLITTGEVLATTRWGEITIADRFSTDKWFIHEGNSNAVTSDILAWMPLPKPYGERRER